MSEDRYELTPLDFQVDIVEYSVGTAIRTALPWTPEAPSAFVVVSVLQRDSVEANLTSAQFCTSPNQAAQVLT